ncbi:MAG TPA: NAD-dependent epimerase/dehydratase family protein [Bacteroidia bacterium]|jgi:nucleoside-diphosphate-sugar epimerase|nr:NAD-dependent epimerase/dehydratase family protein [Bacteroidia bacterium]
MANKILVIGAGGQIGKELVQELCKAYGNENVVASDIRPGEEVSCAFESLDVMDANAIASVVKKHNVKEVYLLAALLSATAEKFPEKGWQLNMEGLFNVLNLAKEKVIDKLFWPSSIAVFGPNTPKQNTPQYTIMEPSTVYGISKQAGERWCEYYNKRYGVDVRSIRYPGLIGYQSAPGGGTTDYAVHIFHEAIANKKYECFLSEGTVLPMMYMEDALRATIGLMQTDASKVKIRSAYNLAGISFSPAQIANEIRQHIPEFKITYKPDSRQAIADSWPQSIDDSEARKDWGWKHKYSLETMTKDMLEHIGKLQKA